MDVVALAQHGVENAVATLGTATTPFHVGKLLKLADNVVFCFDGDNAGRKAAWRALEVSLPVLADGKVVSFLFLPAEDDPDTFIRRQGKPAFAQALAEAKPLSQFLFTELASHVDMATEEGRARFLAQAKPLVAQIEAPALAAMLRRRLADMARLDPGEIEELIPSRHPAASRRPTASRSHRPPAATAESRLLGRLLLHPEAVGKVPDSVLGGAGADAAALGAAIVYFRAHPGATLGQASAYFDDSQHAGAIARALEDPLLEHVDTAGFDLDSEIGDLVKTLHAGGSARRGDELLRLIESGDATPEQRAEYESLHARLAEAKSRETTGRPEP
jgi:DNA primase